MRPTKKLRGSSRLELIRSANSSHGAIRTIRMEDYLQAINVLVQMKGYAASADISDYLNVSAPSVTKMLKRLGRSGYVDYERYRGVSLTGSGAEVAAGISRRRGILSEFFETIGVHKEIASQDAEGIEHHLDEDTLVKLEELLKFLKENRNRS